MADHGRSRTLELCRCFDGCKRALVLDGLCNRCLDSGCLAVKVSSDARSQTPGNAE